MTAHTSMLHIRIDADTKEQAAAALEAMGLSVSDAVRLFLRRVVADQAIPFELSVPNATTVAAMEETDAMLRDSSGRKLTPEQLFAELDETAGK